MRSTRSLCQTLKLGLQGGATAAYGIWCLSENLVSDSHLERMIKNPHFYDCSSQSMTSPSLTAMPQVPFLGPRPTSQRYVCTKVLLAEGEETPFTEHCRSYENKYRTLQTEIQKLKDQMQELHRDLTKHHSLINTDSMDEILERSVHIDEQIAAQYSAMQTLRAMFEEVWNETFQPVTNEQKIYEAQLHDLLQLKQENSYLMTFARQIGLYILSITKVKERLDPRFHESKEHEDEQTDTVLKIYAEESQHTNAESSATCNWNSDRNKSPVSSQPDKTPKITDRRSQNRRRHIAEAPFRKKLPF